MKKIISFIILLLLTVQHTVVYADFDFLLNDLIHEYGIYKNDEGIFYASIENFVYGRDFLLVCRCQNNILTFDVYNESDGEQLLDSLSFEYTKDDSFTLSLIYYDDTAHIMKKDGSDVKYYALISEMFTSVPKREYDSSVPVAECKNGKIEVLSHTNYDIYNLLNSLKAKKIDEYPYMNKVNTINNTDEIITFLTACTHLTSFNIKNYDYDEIFKYVLYTHKDFEILTDIPSYSDTSSQIRTVSAEYIDFIMNNVLNISPIHPEPTELIERGFCYKDGMYLYNGGFDGDYKTDILRLDAVFDLENDIYYIVFSDIYYENESQTPEYSFAVINTSTSPYKLLRLGMGENLLTPAQINEYTQTEPSPSPAAEKNSGGGINYLIPAAAAVIVIASAAAVFLIVRKKNG